MEADAEDGRVSGEREKRSSVIIRALITKVDGTTVDSRVRNLSTTGACIDNDGGLDTDDVVRVEMGAIDDLKASIVWTRERLAGIRFDRPVNLDAARRSRTAKATPQAGWIAGMNNAYRRP